MDLQKRIFKTKTLPKTDQNVVIGHKFKTVQDTYNNIAKEMMIEVCLTTVWGLDALKDRYPEQIRWRTLTLKIEDFMTNLAISLESGKIDHYQCIRFYINIWKHIQKLEFDYFSRFEDIVIILYSDSKKNRRLYKKGYYDGKENSFAWEDIAFIFGELFIE